MKDKDWDRVAKKYFDEIGSPFAEGVERKVERFLSKLKGKEGMSVIDLGCGIGNLVPFLSKNFKKVVAVDFSSEMLKRAKRRCNGLANVKFMKKDLRSLRLPRFHVGVAVNSVLMPSITDVDKVFSEIYKTCDLFVGVFPAITSDLYRAMLTL